MNIESDGDRHVLLTDLAFPESPRWHDGRLWFSDWGAERGHRRRSRRPRAR